MSYDPAMPILKATPQAIQEAGRHLRAGGLVAFPTETVYGLGGDATNARAVAAIYQVKGRPSFNPLIIHVPDLAAAAKLGRFDTRASFLAKRLWPGSLTLVVPKLPGCPIADLASAGLDTLAIRVPDHPVALSLLAAAGVPLAGPSANRSGGVSPTTADHVEAELGPSLAMILDGGPCRIGLESTVLDLTGERPRLLRPGGVAVETLEASLGEFEVEPPTAGARPASPGMLASHYAPSVPVRLGCAQPRPGEGLLAFGANVPMGYADVLNLSETADLAEAAANLFGHLRALDQLGVTGIATMPVPPVGLGRAINDRLRRAAAPRK